MTNRAPVVQHRGSDNYTRSSRPAARLSVFKHPSGYRHIMSAAGPPKPKPKPRNVKIMRAVYDYTAEEEDELSFAAGDILYILDQSDDDWWKARCKGKEGLIPNNLVEDASGDGSTSPLHDAAKRGNVELLKECLSNRLPVNQPDPAGNTPLHWAARAGQLECIQELLGVPQVGS